MKLCFSAATNDVPYINTITLRTKDGEEIVLDRGLTEYAYSMESKHLEMTWGDVYIWDGEGENHNIPADIFDEATIIDVDIEDDAPADYQFVLEKVMVDDKEIPIAIRENEDAVYVVTATIEQSEYTEPKYYESAQAAKQVLYVSTDKDKALSFAKHVRDDFEENVEVLVEGWVDSLRVSSEAIKANYEERNIHLMESVIKYCTLRDMFDDICFYANGHKYSSDYHQSAIPITIPITSDDMCLVRFDEPSEAPVEATYYDCGECDVRQIVKFCNPDTVTMTFEGEFNSAYNGYYGDNDTEEDITAIANDYGLYPEQGYSWSLAFYKI